MILVGRKIALAAIPIGMMATILVSGCQHSDDSQAAAASAAPVAPSVASIPKGASKEESIQAVEANPHIPPQAKANLVRQFQGGPPNAVSTTAPPK